MNYESPRMPAWGAQGGTMEYGSFQAEEFGDLQRLVDGLFYDRPGARPHGNRQPATARLLRPPVTLRPAQLRLGRPRLGRRLRHRGISLVIGACGQKIANMSTVTFLVTAILN